MPRQLPPQRGARLQQPHLFGLLELVSHPKVRARTRRDVGALLCSAYAKMRAALVGGAGGDRAVAEALDELPEAIDALMSA